jgi:alpha-1,6-mannosyltransferase
MTRSLALLSALGLGLVLLTIGGMLLDLPHTPAALYPDGVNMLTGVLALCAVVYGAAVVLVLRRPLPGHAVWVVFGVAVALRLLLLSQPPALSSDIYRYVWDGRVQAAGINPYRYIPADPALAPLRDAAIYPQINRADYAPTIYPPLAQAVFAATGRIADGVTAMKIAMLGFEVLCIACLLAMLSQAGLPRARILIYAWNPLPLWSFASDGHVDAIAIGLLGLALLLRLRQLQGWAGTALAGAVLAKFLPLAVAPALLRGGRFWPAALAGSAVIIGFYALYSGVGWHVLGFLPSYGSEEGLQDGSGFWLLAGIGHLLPLPPAATIVYLLAAVLGLLALALAVAKARPVPGDPVTLCRDVGLLMLATMLVLSPRYAWYYAWLAVPATVAPSPALLWLAAASVLFYVDPWNNRFLWPALVFLPALSLLALELLTRRRHEAHASHERKPTDG